ncbi:MAG: UvrD-helicase domain-containing protein [Defluviitaleaceae bacterium]|nr:UvrD-helicase domain-containing protein [Defluviitaleaceae bacterium]
MDLQQTLNRAQFEAASHIDGPLLILAGAGSGKTKVLTHRIANMISSGGVSPFNILAITFTNKAANEMRNRVNAICREGSNVWVSTFHSLCVRLLRREIHNIGYDSSFTVLDADDSLRLIKKCLDELGLSDKMYPPKSVVAAIGRFKDQMITPEAALRDIPQSDFRMANIAEVYKLYSRKLRQNNSLDFDDLIMRTVQLFTDCQDVLERYRARFRYIMVDEYQDTNAAQYELVRLLSEKHRNICVVGDDDQSIYGWRGADIRNILDFEKDFVGAKAVKLEQNYRSTRTILEAANSVIRNNSQRKAKQLWTDAGDGSKIGFRQTDNDREEARFVADIINKRHAEGGKYADHAVLYRSNFLSRAVEEELVRASIPHRVFGGTRFYDRKEIRDVLAYLRLINNPRDSVSLLRVINVPRRGIGDTTVSKLEEYAAAHDMPLFDVFDELDNVDVARQAKKLREFREMMGDLHVSAMKIGVAELLVNVLDATGYVRELKLEATDEAQGRIENIDALVAKAVEFEQANGEPTLAAFLEELTLVADIDNYDESADAVSLMTMHSSKGLEFDTVFIIGCEEGQFPSYRAVVSDTPAELEEERRLAYVGITRARRRLVLTCAFRRWVRGNDVYNRVSRFVKEISDENVENLKMDNQRIENEKHDDEAGALKSQDAKAAERTGISRYAEINKVRNSIDISFGGKNYMQGKARGADVPAGEQQEFKPGDRVRLMKYGVGTVLDVKDAGADTELTVEFEGAGKKKILAGLSKIKKVEE